MAGAKTVTNQEKPRGDERTRMALQLRRIGHTYEQIALMCGYSHASNARKAILHEQQKILSDDARALSMLQLQRIDMALVEVMTRITSGGKDALWAVDRLVPLLKRQAELLGLDLKAEAPTAQMVIREYGAEVDQT